VAYKVGAFPQHQVLHAHWPNDCCLCRAEERAEKAETELLRKTGEVGLLMNLLPHDLLDEFYAQRDRAVSTDHLTGRSAHLAEQRASEQWQEDKRGDR
jgi:hypothetical protein